MIKEITFGGEKRPVKYGWAALAEFGDLTGTGLNDLGKFETEMGFSDVLHLIYVGLKHGARAEKKEFALTVEDVGDLLDQETFSEDKPGVIAEFLEVFTLHMPKSGEGKAP